MLVRRMATVTICAPLASMARRVSSWSLYLPVPTSRRDAYARPAMVSGLSFSFSGAFTSTSTDGVHDLEPVAVGQQRGGPGAARHDGPIQLDRDAPVAELEFLDQARQREPRGG